MNLGLDHIPKLIDVFLDIEHRQRHGTSEPQRRLCKVKPRTCPTNNEETERISWFGRLEGTEEACKKAS